MLKGKKFNAFALTSDLLVRDDFCAFVLLPVFHGFVERRVAEEVACGRGG